MELRIEKADPTTHQTLTEIAHAAKRHWGYPERWMQLWREALTITPDYIADNGVYVVQARDEIIGFYALLGTSEKLTLDHLWLTPSYMGSGIGKALFNHAVALARQLGATEVEIEADPNAVGFYERMGAVRFGETEYEVEGQPRILPLLIYKLA